jgi:uncharacterized protein YjbJ (UPF0337 family)
MNWSDIESGWKDYKANAKQEWTKLSDDQINATMGKREYLSSRLQEVYSQSREDTERQISAWQSKQVEQQGPAAKS